MLRRILNAVKGNTITRRILICINVTIGEPTSAVAFAINRGWSKLIVTSLLVDLWGYVIGNYIGVIAANLVGMF